MRKNNTTSDADRKRICYSYEQGLSTNDISLFLNIKKTTVHEIIKLFIKTGNVIAKKRGSSANAKLNEQQKIQIKNWVEEDVTISLKNICQKILDNYGIVISKSTVARILDSFHFSLKRIHTVPEKRNDPNTILQRLEYARLFIGLPAMFDSSRVGQG